MAMDQKEIYMYLVDLQKLWKDPPIFLMGKLQYFEWAMFNSYVKLTEIYDMAKLKSYLSL